jgi:hypothetical protein
LPNYVHEFEDGRQAVLARAYPNELLPDFRKHFSEVWLRYRARKYFSERDPKALEYLPKLLPPKPTPPAREPASRGGSIGLESEREYPRLAVAITAMSLKNYRESAHDAESRTHDRLEHFESQIVQRAAGRYAQVAGRGSEIG